MDSDGPPAVVLTVNAAAWRDAVDGLETLAKRVVRRTLDLAAKDVRLETGEVSLLLTDDAEMRSLNAGYREKDRPTNVLSFPGLDLEAGVVVTEPVSGAPILLGDVAISVERLHAEARTLGKGTADHFAHLLTHGTLHLLGYDHVNEADAEVMEALEDEILHDLGFAAAYAAADVADADRPSAMSAVP